MLSTVSGILQRFSICCLCDGVLCGTLDLQIIKFCLLEDVSAHVNNHVL